MSPGIGDEVINISFAMLGLLSRLAGGEEVFERRDILGHPVRIVCKWKMIFGETRTKRLESADTPALTRVSPTLNT